MRIRLSIGTAAALGLAQLKTDAPTTTAYLMDIGGRCAYNCAFCAQARTATGGDDRLSRVIWPAFELADVVGPLRIAADEGRIMRACIQVTMNTGSFQRTLDILDAVAPILSLPVSVSTNIQAVSQVQTLFAHGAARVSIALDAATQPLHDRVKGTGYKHKMELLTECADRYPGRISTHFIVGLGESEEDVIRAIAAMYDRHVTVGPFAFTPLKGTRMADALPPEAGTYRRVQLANWLMKFRGARPDAMTFQDGRLVSLGSWHDEALKVALTGEPFRTAGCKNCNRPYYNENPGHGVMYNYPRALKAAEALNAAKETGLFSGGLNDEMEIR